MKLSLKKDLGPLKLEAEARIDQAAGHIRTRFITTVPGQEMVYLEKRREAEDFLSGRVTSAGELPHLARESQSNAISMFDQAVEILTMAQTWATVSALIEATRLTAKAAVAAATTPAQIDAIQPNWSAFL